MFHADDVVCVALINVLCRKTVEVIRTRDEERLEQADIICDIGLGEFDHHQEEKEYYKNGIMYAACGKVARALAADPEITNFGEEELELLLTKALYSVQAFDNGQDGVPNFPNPFTFVSCFNNLNSNGGVYDPKQDYCFGECVSIAERILIKLLGLIKEEIHDRKLLEEYIANKDGNIMVMDKFVRSWQNAVVDYNDANPDDKILMVVFPGRGEQFNIQVVPKFKDPSIRDAWVFVPRLVEEIEGFIFRHTGRFMAVFDNKESAIKGAKLSSQMTI